jgi:uncharacterized protein
VDERHQTLDLLRGVALIGVLLMNIPFMGQSVNLFHPPLPIDFTKADWRTFGFASVFVEGSARGLFTILFGAGVLLITSRSGRFDGPIERADVYFRRNIGLMVLGVANILLLLWPGDIILFYGGCGLLLFVFRKLDPKMLLALGLALMVASSLPAFAKSIHAKSVLAAAAPAERLAAAHQPLSAAQQKALTAKKDLLAEENPSAKDLAKETAQRRGGWTSAFGWSAKAWGEFNSGLWFLANAAECLSFMMIGMALFKWGVLTGERSNAFFLLLMLTGYGFGLAWRTWNLSQALANHFGPGRVAGTLGYEPARLAIALGHIGCLSLLWRLRALGGVGAALQAFGRMALTNYLAQSAVTSIIFYGLGYYGQFGWAALWAIAAAILIAQILFSVAWLKAYRFGPMEWVLRSLAYWRAQPMAIGQGSPTRSRAVAIG